MRAAPPSAGRRGLTLAGGSRSSRPLVKTPGGCIRRGRGRRKEVSLYIASTSAKVNSKLSTCIWKKILSLVSSLSGQWTQINIKIKYTSKPCKTFHKRLWEVRHTGRHRKQISRQLNRRKQRLITHSSCRNDPARCDERFGLLYCR